MDLFNKNYYFSYESYPKIYSYLVFQFYKNYAIQLYFNSLRRYTFS